MYISDGGQNVSHQCNFSKERTRYHQLEYHDDNIFRVHVPSIFNVSVGIQMRITWDVFVGWW